MQETQLSIEAVCAVFEGDNIWVGKADSWTFIKNVDTYDAKRKTEARSE
jgi:hypothetical protein